MNPFASRLFRFLSELKRRHAFRVAGEARALAALGRTGTGRGLACSCGSRESQRFGDLAHSLEGGAGEVGPVGPVGGGSAVLGGSRRGQRITPWRHVCSLPGCRRIPA
jgi:hypothetical protein